MDWILLIIGIVVFAIVAERYDAQEAQRVKDKKPMPK